MALDSPVPFATSAQFMGTAFADLASNLPAGELDGIMIEATRACEDICDRRLAPFTMTETHRAAGIDPDEYGDATSSLPLSLAGANGVSYANALSAGSLVRHMWLESFAPRYPELWTPYTVTSLSIVRSIGGDQAVVPTAMIGPEPDSGHLWFQIGTFLPVGSLIRVSYSGGYGTIPATLVRAGKLMAASIIVRELAPGDTTHDPELLRSEAAEYLVPFM